jgi:hypothetical protein
MNPNVSNFIKYAKNECSKHGIKVDITPRKYLILTDENYIRVNGYFSEEDNLLKVASNKPFKKWFPVFLHEFCHFLQWKENCKIWQNSVVSDGSDASMEVFSWVDGKKIPRKKLDTYIRLARDVELDCERRVCKLIKKFNLPLDIEQYAQQANAYVYLYNWLRVRRKWYKTGNAPYENPKIWKNLPKSLKGTHNKMPKYILELFDEHC